MRNIVFIIALISLVSISANAEPALSVNPEITRLKQDQVKLIQAQQKQLMETNKRQADMQVQTRAKKLHENK